MIPVIPSSICDRLCPIGCFGSPGGTSFAHTSSDSFPTSERALVQAASGIGPVIALGRPGERISPRGAVRVHIDHAHWQEVVKALEAATDLVILRIGKTEGVWWEIKHLVEASQPFKTVIYLPRADRALYAEFCEKASAILPRPLPRNPGKALFLAFGPDWSPYLIGPSALARVRHWLLFARTAPAVREALRKIMAAHGVLLSDLRPRWIEWVMLFTVCDGIAVLSILIAKSLHLLI